LSQSIPTTIGKYQIIREIARSNDIVYEAYDPVMHRRVAVKELAMPAGASEVQRQDRLARFMREARAAGSLVHPNIVTIYEVAEDAGRHYIAMEFLDGQTLRQKMESEKTIAPDEAVKIAKAVLAGLGFAHAAGVIHRDVKPDNIQVLTSGAIKLTDFGIARLTFEPNITSDGQVFGTPSYMSPEQIKGGSLDASSDLFSLGVILYEMIAGSKPFQGDNVVAIAYAIANIAPEPLTTAGPVWRAIEKSLEKSPTLRYRSADEMSGALSLAITSSQQPSVLAPMPTVLGAPPPILTPQVPTSSWPAPSGTPYGQPYGQPYNPAGGGSQSNMGGAYVPVPIYYPPPPRQPLLSANAKDTMRRFAWAVAVIGLLFALVIFAIQALGQNLSGSRLAPAKESRVPEARTESSRAIPLQENRISDPEPTPDSGLTAADYVRLGGDEVRQAANEPEVNERLRHWNQSATYFSRAIEASPQDTDEICRTACQNYLAVCDYAMVAGYTTIAWEAINQAKGFTNGNSELIGEVSRRENGLLMGSY